MLNSPRHHVGEALLGNTWSLVCEKCPYSGTIEPVKAIHGFIA